MANVKAIATTIISVIIVIVIVFQLVGSSSTEISRASGNITAENVSLPLKSLFASNGVVLLIFMVGILLLIIGVVLKKVK